MDELQQGIAALKAGQRDEARKLLAQAIRLDPKNERAWLWMFNAANNDQERIQCLERTININPQNQKAKDLYSELQQKNQTKKLTPPQTPTSANQKNFLIGCASVGTLCLAVIFCAAIFIQSTPTQPIPPTATIYYAPIQQPVIPVTYQLKYVIRGTAKTGSITYSNAQGGTEQMDITLPFSKTLTINDTFFAYIAVQNNTESGTVTCEIWFNGEKIKTSTSTAQFGIADCSDSVP